MQSHMLNLHFRGALFDGLDRLYPVSVTRIKATFFAVVYLATTDVQINYIECTIYLKNQLNFLSECIGLSRTVEIKRGKKTPKL